MTSFNVMTLGDFVSPEAMEVVIESFADFYHEVTPKHQKKLKLHIIGGEEYLLNVKKWRQEFQLDQAMNLVDSTDELQIRNLYNSDAVLMLPIKREVGKVIPEAFSFGVPILCFDTPFLREAADNTCAMFTPVKSKNHCVPGFKRNIGILYFDPEVRKILHKGAVKKYESMYQWGQTRLRVAAVG